MLTGRFIATAGMIACVAVIVWAQWRGHPLTEQARLIERIRRLSYGNLEVELTVDDAKAYTKPWTRTLKLLLAPNTQLVEFICNENEQDLQFIIDAGKTK